MIGLIIAIVLTVIAGYLIGKKAYAAAVLLVAGVIMLAIAVAFGIGPGLGLKKSTGSSFFDIFLVVENVMSTTLAKLGLSIMCMAGFAKYMDRVHAGRALYDVVGGPLKYVKSPYVLAGFGLIVTQIVGMAIPSAAGLALMMMVTLYPVMIRAGVPKMTAVCTIAASRFFDLGPGSANCLLTAKTANIEWADYFINWQMVIYPFMLITMLVSMYFAQRYWDKKEGVEPLTAEEMASLEMDEKKAAAEAKIPKIYALLPVLPLFILLLFNPVVLGRYGIKIKVGVPTAIVLSVMVAMLFDLIRTRKVFDVMNGLKDFFKGMGGALSVVVSLIIAGQVFGKGLIAIGAVKTLIDGAQAVGLGAIPMVLAMCLVILVISFLMGSGNAPFFSFAPLIPDIATQWGIHTATFLLPLQTMTGLGRTMSPVTGAIVAVAGMANVSPFRIVKRNAVPLLATTVVCLLVTFILMF
ncbi:C4-dicarboxylate transporter DcuC [Mesosutterella sp. OilRF-GAM-744-9]|uniref:C4-dicarboxylate transporter DcuC n=1 Tax=Mesosutterella porci TaxID=2915351 RepID=A0ABS9MN28_9BURK|nr:C4-dicarboxylate transporter DcuC [Mesosutterella sp. oilRF-744-WT-GAM-9]MCG5030025.1 C4-dicarboxylate transporter DcuC [Mesosutterella sp. oilRF-744-WT-GAM-9]